MGAAEIPALSKPARHAGRRAAIHLSLNAPFRRQTFGQARAQQPLFDQPRNTGALRLAVVGNRAEGAVDDPGADYDHRRRRWSLAFLRPASIDRKSTRLNSSHLGISYAVFCLKKK